MAFKLDNPPYDKKLFSTPIYHEDICRAPAGALQISSSQGKVYPRNKMNEGAKNLPWEDEAYDKA